MITVSHAKRISRTRAESETAVEAEDEIDAEIGVARSKKSSLPKQRR